jgi:hypothetical protein
MVNSLVPAVARAFWRLYYFETVKVCLGFAVSCCDCCNVCNGNSWMTTHHVNNVMTLVVFFMESIRYFNAVLTGCEIRRQSVMILCRMTFNENQFAYRVMCKQADSKLSEANNSNVTIYAILSGRRRSDNAALVLNFCGGWRWVLSLTPRSPYPHGKRSYYTLNIGGRMGPRAPIWALWKSVTHLSPARS